MRISRLVLASLSAPAAAAATFYLSWIAWLLVFTSAARTEPKDHWSVASGLFATWPIVVYAFVCALVAELAVGLPLFALFRRIGWLSAKGFLLGGCVVALLFFLVMRGSGPGPITDLAVALLLVLVPSCLGAVVFGYVGGWLTSRLSGPA